MIKQKILSEQMHILFRGKDADAPSRKITPDKIRRIRELNIELVGCDLYKMDEKTRTRAERTIDNLRGQL